MSQGFSHCQSCPSSTVIAGRWLAFSPAGSLNQNNGRQRLSVENIFPETPFLEWHTPIFTAGFSPGTALLFIRVYQTETWRFSLKNHLKTIIVVIVCLFLIMIIYWLAILPLPFLPLFDGANDRLVGFIACRKVYSNTWHNISISGEFASDKEMFGVAHPLIKEPYIYKDCPAFVYPR